MIARPAWAEIDSTAFAANLAVLRDLLPPGRAIWQVCKGDGYGLGTLRAAAMGAACGIDRFCAGTPDEALALRAAQPGAQVLLFPSASPGDLPALARAGVIVSLHNRASLAAILRHAPKARCWLKIDTGLHRYGLDAESWPEALSALRAGALPGLEGVYTHFSQSGGTTAAGAALSLFDRCLAEARAATRRTLPAMVAASPLLLARPDLPYEAVDPGRALYGMLQPAAGPALRPVVRAIRTVLLDSHSLPQGATVGYGGPVDRPPTRTGAFPVGHFDGLPARPPFGRVLIRGRAAPVLGRTLLASMVDLSDIPDARDGDPVTLVGQDGDRALTMQDLADDLALSVTDLHFGLVRALPKRPATDP